MRLRFCLLGVIFLWTGLQGIAQKFQYVHYQGTEVPFENVNQAIQDSLGYMWLGTDQGLFRFDGKTFEDHNTSLRSKTIRAFAGGGTGTLVFSNDTGIYSISYDQGKPQIKEFRKEAKLKYPTELFIDTKGRYWAGLLDGQVYSFTDPDGESATYQLGEKSKTAHTFFGEDRYGTLWALIPGEGLFYYDENGRQFVVFESYEDVNHFLVLEDTLWMVGENIYRIVLNADHSVQSKKTYRTSLSFNRIAQKNAEYLMLATASELYTFPFLNEKPGFTKVFGSNDPHRVEDLPFESINQLHFTRDQMSFNELVWVSSENGLGLLWYSFFQTVFGLGYDNVLGLHATDNGKVLLSQGPVYEVNNRGNSVSFSRANELNSITGIATNGPDTWYGSTQGEIFHYRNNSLYRKHDLSWRGGGVFFIYVDHTDKVWFCQATSDKPIVGVARLDESGRIIQYGTDKGFQDRVLVIKEGGKNELYAAGIGISSYLYKYDREQDRFVNKSLPFPFPVSATFEVHDMAVDDLGIVWLATTDGLLKYDSETIRKVAMGEFTHTEIRSISAMPDRSLWFATDTYGLIHLDDKGNYVVFDENAGTPSKVSAYRCLTTDSNSQLWVGTAEGLVHSLQSLPGPLPTKMPVLQTAVVGGEQYSTAQQADLSESEELLLRMTTITFPSDNVRYQYKVFERQLPADEISDLLWNDSEDPEILLSGLSTGTHRVLVRAQKEGGYAWSMPMELEVYVSGMWYKTWWGILLLAVLVFLFFWYFVRRWFRKRIEQLQANLLQKQQELSSKEAELATQSDTLKHQQQELKNTGTNIHLLHQLIQQISKDADKDGGSVVFQKLVDLPTGIGMLEVANKSEEYIDYLSYSPGGKSPEKRRGEFNDKDNLASYAMVREKTVKINDFEKEVEQYISGKDTRGFPSRLFIPFDRKNGSCSVLCIYAIEKNAFTRRHVMLLEILVKFIGLQTENKMT
ncbi:ligand-binding sensor domain-containing protein [Poritiphilus flavus]|uniref:Ligand-binding sensor domain-containing protein n=1 Tax=Poritiphilus flavus TaxID=2697053 RepID=A0A6L9EA79_9FLAO|nr:hypothetical protein [Poritiphilus flavus]NAS11553.1 hypothetical protein [Poritiphilus flavus]